MYPFWNLSYVLVLRSLFCFQTRQLPRTTLNLFRKTPVYTRKFADVADAIDKAIEFIMDDLQNNICVLICDPLFIEPLRPPFILRFYKVPGDEPLDAVVSGTSNTEITLPFPWSFCLPLFRFYERLERDSVFHIFSETFFKRRNRVL